MSFQAMTWAIEQACSSSGQKLVLLMLANHTNGHTGKCTPSHKLLAQECCMGVSTLKGHLQALADAGLIRIMHRSHEGVSLPNQYQLHMKLPGQDLADTRQKLADVGQNLAEGGSESGRGVGQNLATEPGNINLERNLERNQKKTPAKPARFDPLSIELPDGVSKEAWGDWIAYRKTRKLSTTELTARAQLMKLTEWAANGHQPAQIIAESIANGWQGLFEPKGTAAKPTGKPRTYHDLSGMDYTRGIGDDLSF
jgi:hypothetical protein